MLQFSQNQRLLITAASPVECEAIILGAQQLNSDVTEVPNATPPALWQAIKFNDFVSLLHTGVGKANAAGAVATELARSSDYAGVMSIGIAGSYDSSISLRSSVLGVKHWMLDEGTLVQKTPGWISLEEAGWAKISIDCDNSELHESCRSLVDHTADVATISTISGTTELKDLYLKRAGVKIETMESGAIALVCSMRTVPFADLRVISNFCGERVADNHDFPGALKKVSHLVQSVLKQFQR